MPLKPDELMRKIKSELSNPDTINYLLGCSDGIEWLRTGKDPAEIVGSLGNFLSAELAAEIQETCAADIQAGLMLPRIIQAEIVRQYDAALYVAIKPKASRLSDKNIFIDIAAEVSAAVPKSIGDIEGINTCVVSLNSALTSEDILKSLAEVVSSENTQRQYT